jgi:hypothetical protein
VASDYVPPRTKKSNGQHFICGIFSTYAALGYVDVISMLYAALCVLWEQNAQTGAELGARLAIDSATALGAYYHCLANRLGQPKAITATPRKLAILVYRVLRGEMVYRRSGRPRPRGCRFGRAARYRSYGPVAADSTDCDSRCKSDDESIVPNSFRRHRTGNSSGLSTDGGEFPVVARTVHHHHGSAGRAGWRIVDAGSNRHDDQC